MCGTLMNAPITVCKQHHGPMFIPTVVTTGSSCTHLVTVSGGSAVTAGFCAIISHSKAMIRVIREIVLL